MDAFECIATKLDIRDFAERTVPSEVILKVLEAGRLTASGINKQHWHFILITRKDALSDLAAHCPRGPWVAGAAFAVILLTSPRWDFHMLDAGRALQDMQLAAWNYGVASCPTTVFSEEGMRIEFNVPRDLSISAVIGFGYPVRKIRGRKERKPIAEIASIERYGNPLTRI